MLYTGFATLVYYLSTGLSAFWQTCNFRGEGKLKRTKNILHYEFSGGIKEIFSVDYRNVKRTFCELRESSFNMTKGGGMKILKLDA